MPKKVLPTEEEFRSLEEKLVAIGFRGTIDGEVTKDIKRNDLMPPREKAGRTAGLSFASNGLTVRVWTTWVEKEHSARESDSAWVLIEDGKKMLWSNPRIHRTKHFVTRLFSFARYARERVVSRPLCPQCRQFMNIARGKTLHSRYWSCRLIDRHESGKVLRLPWDTEMPPELIVERKKIRRIRSKQKQRQLLKDLERGEPSVPSRISRKTWRHGQTPRVKK